MVSKVPELDRRLTRMKKVKMSKTCIRVNCADVILACDHAIKSIKKAREVLLSIEARRLTGRRWFPVSADKAKGMIDMIWIDAAHGNQYGICEDLKAMAGQSLGEEMLLGYEHFTAIKSYLRRGDTK